MTKGKVVLVPFPFDDLSAAKVRPAVCLTDPVGPHGHVLLAFVTSRVPPVLLDSDVALGPGDPEFRMTSLRTRSAMRQQAMNFVAAVKGERKPLCDAAEAYEDLKVTRDCLRLWKSV